MEAKTLHCSFCGKSQHEVGLLIAGPANICDRCYIECGRIIEERVSGRRRPVWDPSRFAACAKSARDEKARPTRELAHS